MGRAGGGREERELEREPGAHADQQGFLARGQREARLQRQLEQRMGPLEGRGPFLIDDLFHGIVTTLASNQYNLRAALRRCDLLIGAVLIPGASAPKLVTRDMLHLMKEGAVVVDVAVDQGGCFETTHPTTHSDPVYVVDGVVHYCVANMPGAVPITSTFALTNVTLPYVEAIADHGVREAVARDPALARGVNVLDGKITYEAVADAHGLEFSPLEQVLPLSPV